MGKKLGKQTVSI